MTAEVGIELEVAATLLGEQPFRFETVLQESEGCAPTFRTPHQIVLQTPVKLETEDTMWMGTVITCCEEGNAWRASMRVEHVLRNLPELLNLAARFA